MNPERQEMQESPPAAWLAAQEASRLQHRDGDPPAPRGSELRSRFADRGPGGDSCLEMRGSGVPGTPAELCSHILLRKLPEVREGTPRDWAPGCLGLTRTGSSAC